MHMTCNSIGLHASTFWYIFKLALQSIAALHYRLIHGILDMWNWNCSTSLLITMTLYCHKVLSVPSSINGMTIIHWNCDIGIKLKQYNYMIIYYSVNGNRYWVYYKVCFLSYKPLSTIAYDVTSYVTGNLGIALCTIWRLLNAASLWTPIVRSVH